MAGNRGGKRLGAGRKKDSGPYKEATVVKRLPISALPAIEHFLANLKSAIHQGDTKAISTAFPLTGITIAREPVSAGFAVEALDNNADWVDFNRYLAKEQSIAIYAQGNSMVDAGIDEGDLLIISLQSKAKDKDIVIAQFNQQFTVKRLRLTDHKIELRPENHLQNYPTLSPQANDELRIIGVLKFIIKQL